MTGSPHRRAYPRLEPDEGKLSCPVLRGGSASNDALLPDFHQLYADGSIQEAPCLAHIRRKFYDLMEVHRSPIATEAVERVAALYAIEKEIRGRPPYERREVRNTRSRPPAGRDACVAGNIFVETLAEVGYLGGREGSAAREGLGKLNHRAQVVRGAASDRTRLPIIAAITPFLFADDAGIIVVTAVSRLSYRSQSPPVFRFGTAPCARDRW